MAPFLLLLVLLAEAASDQTVEVHPGDKAILPCQAPDSSFRAVEWVRPDLKPDTVLLYNNGTRETNGQNPSFTNRVELVDRDLKDRNVSLTLKNVNINDAGRYECRVASGGSRRKKRATHISIVHLQVKEKCGDKNRRKRSNDQCPPGSDSGYSKDENPKNDVPEDGHSSPGLVAGVVVGLVLAVAAVAVAGVLMYKRQKRPGHPDAAAYKQPAETTP